MSTVAVEAIPGRRTRALPVLARIWREIARPFRPRTWNKWRAARRAARPTECERPASRHRLAAIPTMITGAEAEFFSRCAEQCAGRDGQVVDLGCWMGGTAIALAEGLSRGETSEKIVRAYDIFRWEDWMSRARVPAVHGVYRTGESFLPEARRLVHDHGHGLIELVEADLSDYEWPGEPIQLLLIDAMKSPLLMQRIAATFFPCLRPGGFLLHQDFKHHHTSWIHILHHRLRRHFQLLESVPGGATVGFVVTDPIDAAEVAVASRVDCVSDAEVEASFAYSLSLLPPDEHVQVAAAHLAHYCRAGKTNQAAALAARYSAAGLDVVTGFPLAERTLGGQTPLSRVA